MRFKLPHPAVKRLDQFLNIRFRGWLLAELALVSIISALPVRRRSDYEVDALIGKEEQVPCIAFHRTRRLCRQMSLRRLTFGPV